MLQRLLKTIYKAPTVVFCYALIAVVLLNISGAGAVELRPGTSDNVLKEMEYAVKNGYISYEDALENINGRVQGGGCTAGYITGTLIPAHVLSGASIDNAISRGLISADYDGQGYDELGITPVIGGKGGGGSSTGSSTAAPAPKPAPHEHKHTKELTKVMTCTESGYYTYTCSCGDSYTQEILPIGHEYEETERVEPVCEIEGLITYTCKNCEESYMEPIEAIEHNFLLTETKDSTCVEHGYEIYTCENCKEDREEELSLNPDNHLTTEIVIVTPHGMFWDGVREVTCVDCGTVVETQITPATQDWRVWAGVAACIIVLGTVVTIIVVKKRKG